MADEKLPPPVTLDKLREMKQLADNGMDYLRQAQSAGIDQSVKIAELTSQINQINKLRDAYYPGQTL